MQPYQDRGAKLILSLFAVLLAAVLASCQPKINLDLLNESGQTIKAGDTSQSRTVLVTITNSARMVFRGGNPLIVQFGDVERKYSIEKLPEGCVRTTSRGLVVSIALGEDHKLYLLDPSKKVPVSRLVPQPEPFPLSPTG